MASIKNVATVETMLGRWYPGDLAHIEQLCLFSREENSEPTVEMIALFFRRDQVHHGWPNPTAAACRVVLQFSGVSNISLNRITNWPVQIMGFDIVDITDRGWDNLQFEILDYEDNRIGFYCNSVDILSGEMIKFPNY